MRDPLHISSLFGVQGRTALITGGSSGIGLMIARGLVANGCRVYITALATDPIQEVVDELREYARSQETGSEVFGFPSDLSSLASIRSLVDHLATRETSLDMLISNAGVHLVPSIPSGPRSSALYSIQEYQEALLSLSSESWDTTWRVNVSAHYHLSILLLPLLAVAAEKGDGRGCVIVNSSVSSRHNSTDSEQTAYASSKAATDHLVRLMAVKLARYKIRVNSINPSTFESAMNPDPEKNGRDQKVPLKRKGIADDVTGLVIFLASRAGSYVDGENILLDGGKLLVANGQS
ncbi:short chain dehydrogenase [Phlyctema vagabunda]|uniref:Short chain dehydrogenase n=1 Tax=Phlyctema vagabunda TaxID=108571 RepID=A0ABR4PXH8_9HELO